MANSHERNNSVDSIVINRSMSSDSIEIREHIGNSIISCILNCLVGDQNWMLSHLADFSSA